MNFEQVPFHDKVLLETGTVTANMTRAVADYFDAADVSAKDAVAICQEASGLLYLNPSGDNGATSAAVASLVKRLKHAASYPVSIVRITT